MQSTTLGMALFCAADPPSPDRVDQRVTHLCAWCRAEIIEERPDATYFDAKGSAPAEIIDHGICTSCQHSMLIEALAEECP